jgi:hypothetical protein
MEREIELSTNGVLEPDGCFFGFVVGRVFATRIQEVPEAV